MIYLKKNYDGIQLESEIYDDELVTYCSRCGKEIKLDNEDIKRLESFNSTTYLCADCAKEELDNKGEKEQ